MLSAYQFSRLSYCDVVSCRSPCLLFLSYSCWLRPQAFCHPQRSRAAAVGEDWVRRKNWCTSEKKVRRPDQWRFVEYKEGIWTCKIKHSLIQGGHSKSYFNSSLGLILSLFSSDLEQREFEAITHVRDSVQMVENAILERDQVQWILQDVKINLPFHCRNVVAGIAPRSTKITLTPGIRSY